MRKLKKAVQIGDVTIGGGNPVAIQSMTNTDTRNVEATVAQIKDLENAGCQIIRCAVPDMQAAEAMGEIKKRINIPLVADIHFDYKLALKCMELGVNKIRINPGNIGSRDKVREVVECAKAHNVPLRIGVNGGSLEKDLVEKYKHPVAEALVESAFRHVEILESLNFYNTVVSIKVSDVPEMMHAYRLFNEQSDLPLHVGVTEAGTERMGILKSAVGIGGLLSEGIGDTIRVSLTADPVREIYAAKDLLSVLGLRKGGVTLVSCPTCGRTEIDLIGIANRVEERLKTVEKDIKVAVMGCIVNGPGEARDADVGIAGGKGVGLIFKHGEIIKKVPENMLVEELMAEIEKF